MLHTFVVLGNINKYDLTCLHEAECNQKSTWYVSCSDTSTGFYEDVGSTLLKSYFGGMVKIVF